MNKAYTIEDMQDSYEQGYDDALRWVLKNTYGDNYHLQVQDHLNKSSQVAPTNMDNLPF